MRVMASRDPVEREGSDPGAGNRKPVFVERVAHSNVGSKYKPYLEEGNHHFFPYILNSQYQFPNRLQQCSNSKRNVMYRYYDLVSKVLVWLMGY